MLNVIKKEINMLLIKILMVALVTLATTIKCHAVLNTVPEQPSIIPSYPNCNEGASERAGKALDSGLRFRLPVLDTFIHNDHKMHILQESAKQRIFVLHGHELHQMFISRQQTSVGLIGWLDDSMWYKEHLGAELISRHNNLLLVVAFERYLIVYQISEDIIAGRAQVAQSPTNETVPYFEAIQQLNMPGNYRKMFLATPNEHTIMLILAVDDNEENGRIKTFLWMNTYFDPLEELIVPTINVLSHSQNYLMIGRTVRHDTETILNVYEIRPPSMKLKSLQTLTVNSRTIHFMTFRQKNYFIACSKEQIHCNIFKMIDGQFSVWRQRSSKDLVFNHFTASQHFLVGVRDNEVMVMPNARLECYSTFVSNETDISAVMTHVNENDEHFILLSYVRPTQTIVRVVEIEDESGEALSSRAAEKDDVEDMTPQEQQHHIFEETIGRLRSILLQHNSATVVFRRIGHILAPKLKNIRVQYPVTIKAGNIGIVNIVGQDLLSPIQLLNRIEDLDKRFGSIARVRREAGVESKDVTLENKTLLKVLRLRVANLLYNGNIIEGFHLDATAKPLPILSIRPQIKTKVLNTQELLIPRNFRTVRQPSLGLFDFENKERTLSTRQLNVKSINNMPWKDFYNTVFLKQRDTSIEGRLIMQAATKVQNLHTSLLNGLVVHNLFNLVQEQVVHSNLLIAGIHVSNLQAEVINGLDFANDIVFGGVDNIIKSRVVMQQINVSGDLLLADNTKMERVAEENPKAFEQIYTGKVIINGTLTVNNLLRENEGQIIVDGQSLAVEDLKQRFLLYKTEQHFTKPVTFGRALVTTPHFSTTYLNEHPTELHLLNTAGQSNFNDTLFIIFMSANIENNLICNAYTSRLANISQNAVRHGEVANITGIKIFQAPLKVHNLMTLELNDVPVSELVLKSQLKKPLKMMGTKFFDKVHVANETYIEQDLKASLLNNLPLDDLLNYDYHLDNLTLAHELQVANIVFHKINGISFDKVFMNLKVRDDKLVLHKDLIIEGTAQFSENLVVDLINNVNWSEYQSSLVRLHENAVIYGQKSFNGEVVITKALNTHMLNNLNVAEIFSNILSKTRPQLITGSYSFDELQVSNMDVTVINDMATAAFIDTRTPKLNIDGDIVVPKLIVHGNIFGDFDSALNLSMLTLRMQQLLHKPWRNLHVLGNARWNDSLTSIKNDNMHKLAYLQRNAVTSVGNNIITGNVKLRRPLISKMLTKTAFPKDIDFDYIAKDGIFKNTSTARIITGQKTFKKSLYMQNIEAAAVLHCNQLNNIDILRLNASLYRLSSGEPIPGPLRFMRPPIIGHLAVKGTINGMPCAQIYHSPMTRMPPLAISTLDIAYALQVKDINDMSLDYWLNNRVLKHGAAQEVFGFLTFENLVLNKQILLQSINGIPIDSLVLKSSDNLQAITGSKVIEGDLILAGPAHVMRLNNQELIESYQRSIFKNLDYHFDSLVIAGATFERGLQLNSDSDDHVAAALKTESQTEKLRQRERINAIQRDLTAIDSLMIAQQNSSKQSKHLMYLDYDLDMKTLWQNANESIDLSYSFELERLSICERQILHVQKSSNNKRIFLSNETSSILKHSLNGWSVKIENFCKSNFRKVRSRITITRAKLSKVFGMKKFIENVKLFMPTENQTYVLLHAIDLLGKRNEVRMLKIAQDELNDVQSITVGIGKVLQLFQQTQNHSLLISSALTNNYPTLSIYTFVTDIQQFELMQVIDGDYDIIELVQISAERYHLILSCVHCRRIRIYEYNADSLAMTPPKYSIYQFLKLNQLIDKLLPFSFADGSQYLLVLSEHEHDYYHLYKFSHIQGWLHVTYGYFHNIQLALPLLEKGNQIMDAAGENPLLLLCGNDKNCSLVKAFMQQ